jgi:hypothetical protein
LRQSAIWVALENAAGPIAAPVALIFEFVAAIAAVTAGIVDDCWRGEKRRGVIVARDWPPVDNRRRTGTKHGWRSGAGRSLRGEAALLAHRS